jgi:hypothetical protein
MESGTMTSETGPVTSPQSGTMASEMTGTAWSEIGGTMMSGIATTRNKPRSPGRIAVRHARLAAKKEAPHDGTGNELVSALCWTCNAPLHWENLASAITGLIAGKFILRLIPGVLYWLV